MKEELINCDRCNGNACLHQTFDNNLENWLCFGCGFTTSSQLLTGSDTVNDLLSTLPDLYKELIYIHENKVWIPSVINLSSKGIVFIDGTTVTDWVWGSALMVEIPKEQKHMFPNNQTHKVDMETLKQFGQNDFMDALDYIGFFKLD